MPKYNIFARHRNFRYNFNETFHELVKIRNDYYTVEKLVGFTLP